MTSATTTIEVHAERDTASVVVSVMQGRRRLVSEFFYGDTLAEASAHAERYLREQRLDRFPVHRETN